MVGWSKTEAHLEQKNSSIPARLLSLLEPCMPQERMLLEAIILQESGEVSALKS